MISDYFLLAIKNLRKRGLRSWLTMLGIFLGIAAVVSLISLGSGLQKAILGQFGTLDTNKLLIENTGTGFGPPGSTAVRQLTNSDLELINSINGVEEAIPRFIRMAKVETDEITEFLSISSLPGNDGQLNIIYDALNLQIAEGEILTENDLGTVLVGWGLAQEEALSENIKVGKSISLQGEDFEIAGILKNSGSFILDYVIFLPEEDLKRILNLDTEIDLIVVQVTDQKILNEVAEDIEETLRKDRKQKLGEEDFSVQTPQQSLQAVNTILRVVNLIVSGIAAISLFIGGIGIANTMYTSVLERTKEIGVMKAIGAQKKDILGLFLLESGLLGLIGGIVGIVIGLGLALGISSAAGAALGGISLEVTISWPLVITALLFSLVVGIISGIIPAVQAARLPPVEALRK
ncbi:MAG TPA: ABC transporter permease [Candidatus Nanoarchaeia archaeon]|nr:ABC transporter permease [Candidatus Nanoarchaeia archaeon]